MPAGPFKMNLDEFQPAKRSINACQLYKSPTSGQRVNSSTPITFSWNPACFTPEPPRYVNINLLSSRGQVFQWGNVDAASGSYQTELNAEWWGSTPSVTLQVGITSSDTPLFLSPFVAGPVFTAINSNPTPTTTVSGSHTGTSAAAATTSIKIGGYLDVAALNSKGLTRGRLAAAVLLPILVAFGAIAGYVWFSRRREARRRAEWIDNVDKRMSTISGDWQTMSHTGVRPSMQSSRRTPRPSVHSRTMSMLGGGVRASVSTDPDARNRATLFDRFSSKPFAFEDETQLGPRGRALSAAAAEGRPLSSLIANKELPPPPNSRTRSQSTAADGGFTARTATSRFNYSRAPPSHTRTTSTTSNNPYAGAMVQRDSLAVSGDEKPLPFPPSTSPIPRARKHSNGRSMDLATRSRVISHVSFADVPRPSEDRRRNGDPEKYGMRSSARENSAGDDFAIDFGDALPALALMRVKSGDGLDSIAFPTGDSNLTPTREFLPPSKRHDYFDGGLPNTGLGGRTPDEMLKAYASAMASNEKSEDHEANTGVAGARFQEDHWILEEIGDGDIIGIPKKAGLGWLPTPIDSFWNAYD